MAPCNPYMRTRLLCSALALTACTVHAPSFDQTALSSHSEGMGGLSNVSASSAQSSLSTASSHTSIASAPRVVRRVHVTASGASFVPSEIEVAQGERLQLLVHGDAPFVFGIPAMRIREQVIPGRTTPIDLPTNLVGSYVFQCLEMCGNVPGSGSGVIVVRAALKH